MNFITLLSIFVVINATNGARILSIAPTPTKSHHNLIAKLALDLAARGHQVTLITPYPQEKPVKNLEEIIIPDYYDDMMMTFIGKKENVNIDVKNMQMNAFGSIYALPAMGYYMSDTFLSSRIIQIFLHSDRKYDAIIGETFFIESILAGFVMKYKAPLIALAPGAPGFFSNYMVGNPSPSSYVPSIFNPFHNEMNFKERLINFLVDTVGSVFFHTIHMRWQDTLLRKYFGNDLPYIQTIMENTSLVLVNYHHSLAFPRPYVPNMIEIGGFHVKPIQPLPKDIQQYMDEAKHGVILLSLGSHLKTKFIPKETVEAFLKAFSRLKMNIIWKFDNPNLPNVPKNVKIMKWVPQSDILAHPNLKLFITHGGMLSTTEAILRGVPLIGLPIFGDQPSNMKFVEKNGYGKGLPIIGLNESLLYDTIMEISENPKYKNNAKRGSVLLQDTPLSASETSMYWIEYVIRHKGAPHLRSAALDLKWYELYLLDVLGTIAIIIFASLWIWYKIASFIWRKLCGGKPRKVSEKKKKN